MLSFLDCLCRALVNRDAAMIVALLADPRAAELPAPVRDEAAAVAADPDRTARAPLQAFVFAHRMAQLLSGTSRPADNQADVRGADHRRVQASAA